MSFTSQVQELFCYCMYQHQNSSIINFFLRGVFRESSSDFIKFEINFFEIVWRDTSMNTCIKIFQNLRAGNVPEGFMTSKKYILERPASWRDCIRSARLRFEKYFNHRVHHSFLFYYDYFLQIVIKWFCLTSL